MTAMHYSVIEKQKGPLLLPSSLFLNFYAWIARINTVRTAGAAGQNFSRGVLIINTWVCSQLWECHGPLTVRECAWNLCSTLRWCSFMTRGMRVRVCSPSRRQGGLVFNAKPYLPLNVNMKNMSGVFESFRNCTFGRLGVDFTMFKWKHKYKIQKGVNTSEGRCHSCQNQI